MINRLVAPFVGLLFVLTMSACSNGGATSESEPAAKQDQVVKTATLTDDAQFLADIHKAVPETETSSDADLVRLANLVCDQLDDGYTFQGIVMAFINEGVKSSAITEVLKAAVPIYCPQHTEAMEVNLP